VILRLHPPLYRDMKMCQRTIYEVNTMIRKALVASVVLVSSPLCQPASPQDASFGCKVLLCAAATAPSWSAIPYCVPVMRQLIALLAKGEGWPSCAQAAASPPGYQPYAAYPTGAVSVAASQAQSSGRGDLDAIRIYRQSQSGTRCGAPAPVQTGSSGGCTGAYIDDRQTLAASRSGEATMICGRRLVLQPRPTDLTLYFVEIATSRGVSTFSSSLSGYGK
jgi:hypothetical protein